MTDDKLNAAVNLGVRSRAVLDETMLRAFDEVRKDLIISLVAAPTATDLVDCRAEVVGLDKVLSKLALYIANGKMAQAELDRSK